MKQFAIALLVSFGVAAQTPDPPVLHVEELMESIRQRYPLLLVALAEIEIADAEVLAAEGRFDTTLRTRIDSDTLGYYANRRLHSWIEQPLSWQGLTLFSGYRIGEGDFAPYDGKLATRSLGEVRTGMRLPLLRDRQIDSRRGGLAKARMGRTLASLSADQQKLTILQNAAFRYWTWVALGQRLLIARDVLKIAETRQSLLEEGVKAGQIPGIDAVDNKRAILQRRTAVVEAERAFQQSSIDLSLFLRDASGKPVVPGMERVPTRFPEPGLLREEDFAEDQRSALARRPDLLRIDAQTEQNRVDLELARNASKPAVDLMMGFYSDSGSDPLIRRGPQEVRFGLSFDFPLRNRSARGQRRIAEQKGRQLELRRNFLRDQITAEIQDAFSALRAAHERLSLLGNEVRVSRELEDAERSRFELGEGTLFMLNLREQATMDAALREALAQADYQRAKVAYDYATGALLYR